MALAYRSDFGRARRSATPGEPLASFTSAALLLCVIPFPPSPPSPSVHFGFIVYRPADDDEGRLTKNSGIENVNSALLTLSIVYTSCVAGLIATPAGHTRPLAGPLTTPRGGTLPLSVD
jgi:hypothetical protein